MLIARMVLEAWVEGLPLVRAAVLLLLLAPASTRALAQGQPNQPSLIQLKIETSRPQPTAGTGLGVVADVKNTSSQTVYLHQEHFMLILPPELEGPFFQSWGRFGLFPTVGPGKPDPWDNHVALKPGDTYRVFWSSLPLSSQAQPPSTFLGSVAAQIQAEMHFLFFEPGEYKITVEAEYWTDPGMLNDDYRTVAESATLQVGAPQFVILFGAALGGLVAYFILPKARRRLIQSRVARDAGFLYFASRFVAEAAGVLGSIFLSSIVTILLSRISETQFLVRITVTDVWGGIAIGFLANYAGSTVLDKLLRKLQVPEQQQALSPAEGTSGDTNQPA